MAEHWFLQHKEKLRQWAVRIILFVYVTVIASMCITKGVSGKASIFGYRPYFIMSGSMEPTIKTYQFVLGVPVEPEDVAVGDIIAYNRYSSASKAIKQTVIHRVVTIDDQTVTCKGDNNKDADRPVDVSRIGYKIIAY